MTALLEKYGLDKLSVEEKIELLQELKKRQAEERAAAPEADVIVTVQTVRAE